MPKKLAEMNYYYNSPLRGENISNISSLTVWNLNLLIFLTIYYKFDEFLEDLLYISFTEVSLQYLQQT